LQRSSIDMAMLRCLVALAVLSVAHTAEKVEGVKELMGDVSKMLKEVSDTHKEQKKEENALQNETATFLAGTTDKVAAAVDQTLMGAAEEKLADKQAEDPLLADPLLSLEEEEEEEGTDKSKAVAGDLASLQTWKRAMESAVPLFDPGLFKDDSVAAMDKNDDGLLDENELISHILKLIRQAHKEEFERQKALNKDQVDDIIKLMDEDGDGHLSMDELFSKTTQTEKEKVADKRMFNFADSNHDSKLDAGEMFLLALPQYSGDRIGWYKFKAQDHMEEMDENNDKMVSWEEMEKVLKSYEMDDADKTIERFHRNFKASLTNTDQKADQKLDEHEMTLMVQRMENEDMQVVVHDLISKADDNKDGKLSLNEIIKNVKALKGRMQLFMATSDLLYVNPKVKPLPTMHTVEHMLGAASQGERDAHYATEIKEHLSGKHNHANMFYIEKNTKEDNEAAKKEAAKRTRPAKSATGREGMENLRGSKGGK